MHIKRKHVDCCKPFDYLIYLYIYIYIYIYIYLCVYIYYTSIYNYIFTYVYDYIFIYVCIYIYQTGYIFIYDEYKFIADVNYLL